MTYDFSGDGVRQMFDVSLYVILLCSIIKNRADQTNGSCQIRPRKANYADNNLCVALLACLATQSTQDTWNTMTQETEHRQRPKVQGCLFSFFSAKSDVAKTCCSWDHSTASVYFNKRKVPWFKTHKKAKCWFLHLKVLMKLTKTTFKTPPPTASCLSSLITLLGGKTVKRKIFK